MTSVPAVVSDQRDRGGRRPELDTGQRISLTPVMEDQTGPQIAGSTVLSVLQSSAAQAVAMLIGGTVNSVTVTNGGNGYTSAPTVYFTGGGGFGATGIATLTGGVVTGVTIMSGGSGYTSPPAVSFSPAQSPSPANVDTLEAIAEGAKYGIAVTG